MTCVLAYHERCAAHGLHQCIWCHEYIAARERYADMRVVSDGVCYTQRQHLRCLDLVNRYGACFALDEDDRIDWSEVLAWAAEATI